MPQSLLAGKGGGRVHVLEAARTQINQCLWSTYELSKFDGWPFCPGECTLTRSGVIITLSRDVYMYIEHAYGP
jgi:hypothetical protein